MASSALAVGVICFSRGRHQTSLVILRNMAALGALQRTFSTAGFLASQAAKKSTVPQDPVDRELFGRGGAPSGRRTDVPVARDALALRWSMWRWGVLPSGPGRWVRQSHHRNRKIRLQSA